MALKQSYQGHSFSRDKSSKNYKETFIGTQSEVDSMIESLIIGTLSTGKGYLQSYDKSQDSGKFYKLELTYTTSYDSQDFDNSDQSIVGKKSATLSCRTVQLALQCLPQVKGGNILYQVELLFNRVGN